MSSRGSPEQQVPLARRVVEVIADRGEARHPRYRYGSGCIVRGRTVLTAAHVVAGAKTVRVRDPNKTEYPATVDPNFVGDPGGPGPDLALVQIEDPTFDLPPIALARVDRASPTADPVERCHAIGHPWFAETPSPTAVRDTVDAIGVVPVASKLAAGLLSVLVSVSPRPLPPEQESLGESEWSGMSGAPVVAGGLLLGVVIEHAPREGQSAITAVPLTALEPDPAHPGWGRGVGDPAAWWSRLGASGIEDLLSLPPPPRERPAPAYRATLREIGQSLHYRMRQLLGREQELAEIASFATSDRGYRWVTGGAYAGKTALLYEAVTVGLPPEVDVVSYFLSRTRSDADSTRFLAAVVPQLAYLCEVDVPAQGWDQFYDLWERAARRAAERGRHLLLVVDGLDEDLRPSGSPSVARLLPTVIEERAHVLVASRPYPELPGDMPPGHPLKETSPVELAPFKGSEKLADLAKDEIDGLLRDLELGVDILGLLTAAAGPVSVRDLAALTDGTAGSPTAHRQHIATLIREGAARSLEPVGSGQTVRYQFAHSLLREYARKNEYLADPEYRERIHRWAEWWRQAHRWPTTTDLATTTPRYLLDSYPGSLAADPDRLAALVSDTGWVDAAIQAVGVDRVLADLQRAAAAAPTHTALGAMLAAVRSQAYELAPPRPLAQPGYVSRQLCLQAAELAEDALADSFRERLRSLPGPGLVPLWTTRRASRALARELGRHDGGVRAVAALPNGGVVSAGGDGRVLLWDPGKSGSPPIELSRDDLGAWSVAALKDGRVVSGGGDGRVLLWDPARPGSEPVELGRHEGGVRAMAGLPDGRVVSGGDDGRVVLWDPTELGSSPVELGRHHAWVVAVTALEDGRVASGDRGYGRVLLWDPDKSGSPPIELGRHDGDVLAVAALEGGRVVSAGSDGRMLLWNAAEPGSSPIELSRHDGGVRAIAALPDGRVVSGGHDRRLVLWDPAGPGSEPVEFGRHDDGVRAVAALRDRTVVSGGGGDDRVLLWDLVEIGSPPGELGRGGEVVAVTALLDGRVVSGGRDHRVLLWDPAEPGSPPIELGLQGDVQAVAALPDGQVVSSGGDRWVLLWDPGKPGSPPVWLGRHDGGVGAVTALLDGRVVSYGGGRMLLWDPGKPGSPPVELGLQGDVQGAVAALRDGRVVSCAGVGMLLWDPGKPGSPPVELGRHDGWVAAVAALPNGGVVSGGSDRRVLLWDPADPGSPPVELGRHDDTVRAVAALPDGRVVSGGHDGRVLLWDATTQTKIAQLGCSSTALAAGPSGPDGTLLVVAHQGAGLSFWRLPPA